MTRTGSSLDSVNSPRTPERDLRTQAKAPRNECCLRCGGLLVTSFTASLERDLTGAPIALWRCINCGDCVDRFILANRGKGPGPVVPRVVLPRGPQPADQPRGARIGISR